MTPPSLSSIAPPATHYTSPLHGGDSCREAGLHVPILIGVILVLALLAGTRNLVLLTHIFWALTLLGWVPVAVGFAIKMRNRVLSQWRRPLPAKRNTGPERLPFITILLPVMGEAGMMSQLAAAMARLDYPADRLDCMVLLEAVDRTTPVAAMATQWPDFCRLVTVPIGAPQTKARACNYALRRARGDLLVIFDAEDQPHPKQLREAARRFARHDENLACLQAPLHITPKKAGWLENQFALEYGLLFNFILPCLGRANGALPLGGSSNYFRLSSLRAVGGWDDYNLTEDADLGMRLGQAGYRIDTLRLPTYENAPHTTIIWHRQRTRWLSGHIQTLHTQAGNSGNRKAHFWLGVSCAAILIGRLATIPAHALTVGLAIQHALMGALPPASFVGFGISYAILLALLYRISTARSRRARLFYALTHWLYWLCMLPAFLNAVKRMALGQVDWLKSPHVPFIKMTTKRAVLERVKGIEPSS